MRSTFYHYTNWSTYDAIRNEFYRNGSENAALRPIKRFIRLGNGELPDKAHENALFGVLEPRPESWDGIIFNTGNHEILSGDLLVEAKIADEDDIYIADYSIFKNRSPDAHPHDLFRRYFNSLAPLKNEDRWMGYEIQEVVSFSPIPLSRLKFHELKPRKWHDASIVFE